MSSSQPNNSEDQPHDSDSVEYSGGRGGVYRKRSGKLCLVVGLMSVVVVVIVFLIVGFISYRDAAVAQAGNAGPAQLAPGNPEACVNPCRSPHFFCHPSSERDEKGCFEPGCPCFPEHCHKRCPPDQECVLGSPVDYKGCFRPNCKCEGARGSLPTGDDKALAMGVDQDFNSSSDFRNNHLVVPHNKTETTVQSVSPRGQTDSRSSVSGHVPSPKERHEVTDGPTGFISFFLNLPLSTEGSATHLKGTSAFVVTDSLLRHSNASSSTLRQGPIQFAKVDNASTTLSASQSKGETSHVTLSTVNGNESHGSVKGHDHSSKYANSSSQLDEQNDDDDDDDDNSDISRHDKTQTSTLGGRASSENSTREKSDDVGTIQSEQSPPRQGQDSTSKTSEAMLQATAPTTSSQRGDEGGISSTAMDDLASASSATSQGAAEDQHPPWTTASDSVRK
nr:uncharacterized protein LOC119164864 [Rhipicephalus microplus]